MPRLELSVLSTAATASSVDLVRHFHRAQLQLARSLADEVSLGWGTWLHRRGLQPLPEANCVLDATVEPGRDPADLVAEVDALAVNCPVQGWTVNPSSPADRTGPLIEHLTRTGWTPTAVDVMHLRQLRTSLDPTAPAGLTVVPVRAAYGPFRQMTAARTTTSMAVDVAELRFDDAHLDGWVAIESGRAIATVAMLTDGDVATVTDLYVAPPHRGRGVGRLMLARALEVGGRAGHRHVLAAGPADVLTSVGFETVGRWVQYVRPTR